jgi:hypothetical protein
MMPPAYCLLIFFATEPCFDSRFIRLFSCRRFDAIIFAIILFSAHAVIFHYAADAFAMLR